ncbi:hypothetical protein IWQ62_000763 [Dispira parvispora]|uniref:Uncharacterized protein n=1 Tax=Dispira parvispora TaxID=1520584 RepID=A0A9W8E9T9_9FUNG|nr:hypothetical protein IWQ62_000763 [Dispira parvispora]
MPKHLQVNNTSALADLQAHIAGLQNSRQSTTSKSRKRKSVEREGRNAGIEARRRRDLEAVDSQGEPTSRAVTEALQRKAQLYERLRKRQQDSTESIDLNQSLVDFDRKYLEASSSSSDEQETVGGSSGVESRLERPEGGSPGEMTVEYIDEFGRTRVVPINQLATVASTRQGSWTPSVDFVPARSTAPTSDTAGPTHYDPTYESRTLGTSHYRLSQREPERVQQLANLDTLRKETKEKRQAHEMLANEYQARLQARHDTLRQVYSEVVPLSEPATALDEEQAESNVTAFLHSIRYQ